MRLIRTFCTIAILLLLGVMVQAQDSVIQSLAKAKPTKSKTTFDHSALDRILRTNVRDGLVDYIQIRRDHWKELDDYLDRAAAIEIRTLSSDEQFAYYINLYNATVIRTVIHRFKEGYSVSENDYLIFKENIVRAGTLLTSLDLLEKKIMMTKYKDPKIHVVLVCGALSCPPIIDRSYSAVGLGNQMNENMRAFLNAPSRNMFDSARKKMFLSRIFDWYADDFGGSNEVATYVSSYTRHDVSDYSIGFMKYDWSLNIAPPLKGRWIKIIKDDVNLRNSPRTGKVESRAKLHEVYEVIDQDGKWLKIEIPFGGAQVWIASWLTENY